jgi:hypothetical protein
MQGIHQLFVETGETERVIGWSSVEGEIKAQGPFYELNAEFKPQFSNEQEATQYLVEAIRFWRGKTTLFCGEDTQRWEGEGKDAKRVDLPEEEWNFSYKTPSTCGRCRRAQELLDKIFGDRRKFNALPFVTYHGDRQYSFPFNLLKYFAENGYDSTVRLIEERKQEEARKKAEAEAEQQRKRREEQETKLAERLGDIVISDELRRQILPYADNKSLVIASSNVAVVLTSRSEWGSSGGIGKFDQVHVFCGSQADMKEWQWRDRYSASNDKPWLRVDAIGAVEVSEKDDKVEVKVELVNKQYGNRTVTYTFDPPKPTAVRTLSMEEQATFIAQVEKEVARVMAELNRLWECKPQMVASYPAGMTMPMGTPTYVPYRQPSIKQREFHPEIGVAAFVTEEQIDHRGSDPQIRYELYVLTAGSEKAERKAEDHGYRREGGAFLTIIEVGPEHIVINTKSGKQTIMLR